MSTSSSATSAGPSSASSWSDESTGASTGASVSSTGSASDITKEAPVPWWKKILLILQREWFLFALALAVGLASPLRSIGQNGSPFYPEITMKFIAVMIIFFFSGLGLKTKQLGQALIFWKFNILVEFWIFVLDPAIMFGIVSLLRMTDLNEALLDGALILMLLPTTITSSIILTKTAGGNEAATLFNATFSNMLGIIATPGLVLLFFGSSVSVPFIKVMWTLAVTVIVPVVLGQLVQYFFAERVNKLNIPRGAINKTLLALIVFFSFAKTFEQGIDLSIGSLFIMIAILVALNMLLCVLSYLTFSIPVFHFTPQDIVSALFTTPQKTLSLGVPLITLMYEDDPNLGVITIPLLIYHPMQLVISSFMMPPIKRYLDRHPLPDDEAASILIDPSPSILTAAAAANAAKKGKGGKDIESGSVGSDAIFVGSDSSSSSSVSGSSSSSGGSSSNSGSASSSS